MKTNANGKMLAEDPSAFGISHNHKYSHEFTYLFALIMANFSKKAAIAVATLQCSDTSKFILYEAPVGSKPWPDGLALAFRILQPGHHFGLRLGWNIAIH